jgi:hypothetical protein
MDPMLQFFAYDHLPPHLRGISKPFGDLAKEIVAILPRNPERTVALRKLLEAKDCAVRSTLYQEPGGQGRAPIGSDADAMREAQFGHLTR